VGGFLAALFGAFSFSAAAVDLNYQNLETYLTSKKVDSIESALPELTAKYPDYFLFNTKMYGSLSAQASTFEEPRVIVFGPKAEFILTFNGGAHVRGGSSFETAEYSRSERAFKFRSIGFKQYPGFDAAEMHLAANEIAFETDEIIVSKANPQICMNCHGRSAGPIWAPYFLWQGAYGSDDDHLHMSFDRKSWNPNNEAFFKASNNPQSQGRGMIVKQGQPDRELEGMVHYINNRPVHPRYKWLPASFIETGITRYASGTPFDQLDYSVEAERERRRLNATYAWPSRPNLYFQDVLMELNQDRLLAKLEQAGLKDAFASQWWYDLFVFSTSPRTWDEWSAELERGLAQFTFIGLRPSRAEIEALFRKNVKLEIEDVRGRMKLHERNLGALEYYPWQGHHDPIRSGQEWAGDAVQFFTQFLGLTEISETDRIAFHLETDRHAPITALEILLRDRGIELRDYSMNLGSRSLSFSSGGLNRVGAYLGITPRP
jgi:hypothetical protein